MCGRAAWDVCSCLDICGGAGLPVERCASLRQFPSPRAPPVIYFQPPSSILAHRRARTFVSRIGGSLGPLTLFPSLSAVSSIVKIRHIFIVHSGPPTRRSSIRRGSRGSLDVGHCVRSMCRSSSSGVVLAPVSAPRGAGRDFRVRIFSRPSPRRRLASLVAAVPRVGTFSRQFIPHGDAIAVARKLCSVRWSRKGGLGRSKRWLVAGEVPSKHVVGSLRLLFGTVGVAGDGRLHREQLNQDADTISLQQHRVVEVWNLWMVCGGESRELFAGQGPLRFAVQRSLGPWAARQNITSDRIELANSTPASASQSFSHFLIPSSLAAPIIEPMSLRQPVTCCIRYLVR